MVEMRRPIAVEEAIERVMAHVNPTGTEVVELSQAYGRILAEPIIAKHDVPPFHRSPYDGFAIRAQDSREASETHPIDFNVIGHIAAGAVANRPIGHQEAYRIMTGAALPPYADAIVMLEQTTEKVDGFTLTRSFTAGENISFQGEDAKAGEQLIEAGHLIHPGTIALLATFGYAKVAVGKRPSVGLLATGTELLEVSEPLELGKIRNSNGPMVEAQLTRMGIPFTSYGLEADQLDACTVIVKQALVDNDMLITTGGVSVGDYDYVPQIYERLGATVLFNKVAMRPGSVTTVAFLEDKLLFGLSGNPSACFTGFELFARPALLAMMGGTAPYLPRLQASLGESIVKPNAFTRFLRGSWKLTEKGVVAVPAGFNKSNAVSSIARGNCLIVLPSGATGYEKGAIVDVLLLGTEQGVSTWMV